MSGKAALKSINDAVREKNYDAAIERAQDFLKKDSKHYQAYVGCWLHLRCNSSYTER